MELKLRLGKLLTRILIGLSDSLHNKHPDTVCFPRPFFGSLFFSASINQNARPSEKSDGAAGNSPVLLLSLSLLFNAVSSVQKREKGSGWAEREKREKRDGYTG